MHRASPPDTSGARAAGRRSITLRLMRLLSVGALLVAACLAAGPAAQGKKYVGNDGHLRVALAKQPLSPTGPSKGPDTMANGGIQKILGDLGATVRVDAAALTPDE